MSGDRLAQALEAQVLEALVKQVGERSVALPGVDGTFSVVVVSGKATVATVTLQLKDGMVVAAGNGCGEPTLTFTTNEEDARAMLDGLLSPSVAYMQARLKTSGDPGLVLEILAATATEEFAQWRQPLRPAGAGDETSKGAGGSERLSG
ncbi:MAG: SCP2 sterol-binding domain-containing protein [Acidimicrobiales bacterium]